MPGVIRDKTIVFVGRLVSDKGVDLLLHALELLKRDGILADLTIVGSGPEEMNLGKLANDLGLSEQVAFVGQKSGAALAANFKSASNFGGAIAMGGTVWRSGAGRNRVLAAS